MRETERSNTSNIFKSSVIRDIDLDYTEHLICVLISYFLLNYFYFSAMHLKKCFS